MTGIQQFQKVGFLFRTQKLHNSVTLAFCGIQLNFIRNICPNFGIPNLSQSQDIGQDSDGGISDFWIFGQPFMNKNCHNSRTSHDTDMKLGLVTKPDKINRETSKKFDVDVMEANCDVIVFFPIYGQFPAIWKPDSGRIV